MPLPYPIARSLADHVPIIYLLNEEIREILGVAGVKRVCNIRYLFNNIFDHPDKFISLFQSTDMLITGRMIESYVYRGDNIQCCLSYTCTHPNQDNSIIIYARSTNNYKQILSYLSKYKLRRNYARMSTNILFITEKGINIKLRKLAAEENPDYGIWLTNCGFSITHMIFPMSIDSIHTMWTKDGMKDAKLGVPDVRVQPEVTLFMSELDNNVPIYMAPYCNIIEPNEELTEAMFICHRLSISLDGVVSSIFYLTNEA